MRAPFFTKYIIATATYGILRSIPRLYDREDSYFNRQCKETQTIQMLCTEKVARAFLTGCTAPVTWPFLLFADMQVAEIKLTNKNLRHYGFNKDWGHDVWN